MIPILKYTFTYLCTCYVHLDIFKGWKLFQKINTDQFPLDGVGGGCGWYFYFHICAFLLFLYIV